ncbi:MAG: alanine--tRNA ligase [Gammaproteobacteria bacterium]|jgi:alanyl-tRNA synthetase|nr:alanine--tRNA ligase [Gammaproteobacteria bacterium]MBT3722977.1 alanine--tRNA ligase [Gammaproteobacteria bacterium]MBT4194972.1 alanine--tRNA ligase [Gammaproteobacteria bacterium]MBT4449271.1 alanine--tRNA ligase [Gammaproteobacteria bacterium]MBT4859498.1 alanine--tRNA ligase [Gammaproteobacteria bacterium]
MTSSAELREIFLTFFANKGHEIVPSSPLVPGNDPTLLFTNAGMVQFKELFQGIETRSYSRATSSQRCVRAGGKHNDLENVGYTARHHTFFEMLGNFSFGDYFKHDAIKYAWEFLTEEIGLPADKLWVTVFNEDQEAEDIWLKEMKVDPARFSRIGAKDNFWQMGDTGPCGPCSEIFYDHGEEVAGGPPGTPEEDGDRYIEIWNLVFMQYDRSVDGTMTPLPKPSVDTGLGLERLAAILQGVHNNYDIDLFKTLISKASSLTGVTDLENKSLRVIADHIRSCAFMIVDGVLPSNEGRGYVLRRIIRRASRHGHQLGCDEPFFYQLVDTLSDLMGDAYPELVKANDHVAKVLLKEEQRFAETLEHGMKILQEAIQSMQGKVIDGDTVFKLYDTYGFPFDLTADVAREQNIEVDLEGFEKAMSEQKNRARASSQFAVSGDSLQLEDIKETAFQGYEDTVYKANISGILIDGTSVDEIKVGDEGVIILDNTPFYGESGGQVGDTGELTTDDAFFEVSDTQKQKGVFLHVGQLKSGSLKLGSSVNAQIDEQRRQAIKLNHSATHLMHEELRVILGDHVQQKGSLVDPEKLRFDFSHFQPLSGDEIRQIEDRVNAQIRLNRATSAEVMSIEDAKQTGAMMLFGEKYGETVRVLSIGSESVELCGGIHVDRAGDIGLFKIVMETGVASGVRRIEAVTGELALDRFYQDEQQLDALSKIVKSSREAVLQKVESLQQNQRKLEKELEQLKAKLASQAGGDLASEAVEINGIKVLAAKIDGADVKTLRDTVDQLKNKLGQAAIVLASTQGEKITMIAGVTKQETSRIRAGDLVNVVAQQCGGKGGGRPDMAQAGGNQPDNLPAALKSVAEWVENHLS